MKKVFLFILSLIALNGIGQNLKDHKKDENWYDFKKLKSEKLELTTFTTSFKNELSLTNDDDLIEIRKEKDNTGRTHIFYQHYIGGTPVEGSQLILHSGALNDYTEIVNDKLIKKIKKKIATLTEKQCLNIALSKSPSQKYSWNDIDKENEIKEETKDKLATNFPKGKLIYTKSNNSAFTVENYKLCYKYTIYSVQPFYKRDLFINVNTGQLLKVNELIINCNDLATATTLYNGNQQIITDWKGWPWSRYILIDCNNRNIHTKFGENANREASNSTTNWGTIDQTATSFHWAAERTWDLYRNVYGRNGTNNANREVKGLVDFRDLVNNANYDLSSGNNDKVRIGRTSIGDRSLSTLDIVGHEITHGLTRATANLAYVGQSGALNESFSDIFGFMVERFSQGGVFDWRMGEDAFQETGGIRDLINPNLFNQPSFQGQGTIFGAWNDNANVHTNSGVPNRWFSLLANGGTQLGVNVNSIGIDKAALVAWNTLVYNLGENSNFIDARNASINVARALYGDCSTEVVQVTNAWAAVGVGVTVPQETCINIYFNLYYTQMCVNNNYYDFPIIFDAFPSSTNGIVTWNVPSDFTYFIVGNRITITNGPTGFDISRTISATFTSNLTGNTATCNYYYWTADCTPDPRERLFTLNQDSNNDEKSKVKIINDNSTSQVENDSLQKSKAGKLNTNTLSIYPNPVLNDLTIEVVQNSNLIIYNSIGQIVFQQFIVSGKNLIKLNHLKNGSYLLKVSNKENLNTKKIIIQK